MMRLWYMDIWEEIVSKIVYEKNSSRMIPKSLFLEYLDLVLPIAKTRLCNQFKFQVVNTSCFRETVKI